MSQLRRFAGRIAIAVPLALVVYVVFFHHTNYQQAAIDRERVSDTSSEPIEIAIVWPRRKDEAESDSFIRGVNLAAAEVNNSGGIETFVTNNEQGKTIKRRKLVLRFFDDRSVDAGMEIASVVANNTRIVAAIGHVTRSAIPASIIYNRSDVLFIAPTNADPDLSRHGFKNVFSIAPDENLVAHAMVEAAGKVVPTKEIRLAVLYPDIAVQSDFVKNLRDARQRILPSNQVAFKIVETKAYRRPSVQMLGEETAEKKYQQQLNYREVVQELVAEADSFDIVLIMDVLPDAELIRRQLQEEFDARKELSDKTILDLDNLNWSRESDFYTDIYSKNTDQLFVEVVELVLKAARQPVAILASSNDYGTSLGMKIWSNVYDRMDDPLKPLSMELYRAFAGHEPFMPLVADVMRKKPEFVFIAGTGRDPILLIEQLRDMGLTVPVICGPGLESDLFQLDDAQRRRLKNTYVISPFDAGSQRPRVKEFVNSFKREFLPIQEYIDELEQLAREFADHVELDRGSIRQRTKEYLKEVSGENFSQETQKYLKDVGDEHLDGVNGLEFENAKIALRQEYERLFEDEYANIVDARAAAGYVSIRLLEEAIERSQSASPKTLAAAMLLLVDEDGIFGNNSFSESGNLLGLNLYVKPVNGDGMQSD